MDYIDKKKKEILHLKHEFYTAMIYHMPFMLPDRYNFVLTNLCNLKCSFCFQKKDLRDDRMTLDDWKHITDQLPKYSRVTITGGDPFMFPEFEEIFTYIAKRVNCNITTNGLLLTKENMEMCLSFPKFKLLSVSIDNVGNTIRDVNAKQWERTEKNIQYFSKRKKEIRPDCILEAKTVVLDENAHDLLEIHKYCVDFLGCDHHSFQFLKGSPAQHADYYFTYDDVLKKSHAPTYKKFDVIKKQLKAVQDYNVREKKTAFLHPKVGFVNTPKPLANFDYLNNEEHVKENYQSCKFPWSTVHINVDGVLFPCLAIPMGNVKTMSLAEIIHGKDFKRFKDMIRKEGTVEGCNRCGWLRPSKGKKIVCPSRVEQEKRESLV